MNNLTEALEKCRELVKDDPAMAPLWEVLIIPYRGTPTGALAIALSGAVAKIPKLRDLGRLIVKFDGTFWRIAWGTDSRLANTLGDALEPDFAAIRLVNESLEWLRGKESDAETA